MKYIALVLLLAVMTAHAEFYRSIDEHGNVVYSDQPSDDAEKIELKGLSTYTPAPIEQAEPIDEPELTDETELVIPEYQVAITSPKQNEAFWSNGGTVAVTVNVQPELSAERHDQLVFTLDGKPVGKAQSGLTITLEGVERGSHILVATVVDQNGKTLQRSKSTLFHLHKRSVAQ